MTPGINLIKSSGLFHRIHEYHHDASAASYGLEAVEKMQVVAESVFKTLVVKTERNEFVVAVLPVSSQLSMKRLAKSAGSKKAEMAKKNIVERITGYVLGGVCPLGQKKNLLTILDKSAMDHQTIFVSAGRRGMEIELKPNDLVDLTQAQLADIAQN
ncbi:MAG: Cys-tRNA(Pro) deacylase [Pseudomonadales bacterium]|nr:Cys-tRNA(Pro) deacylase [Pseudomonadales bacterium]